jgi:hypothetical protein
MTTIHMSVVPGGVLCVAETALQMVALPKFISYDARRRTALDVGSRDDAHV